jgi:hypothetical protein
MRGFRLLPASNYPDDPAEHTPGAQPGSFEAQLMSAQDQPASQFPGVNLTDGHGPAANPPQAGTPATTPAGAEHPSTAPSAQHSSASWWERT